MNKVKKWLFLSLGAALLGVQLKSNAMAECSFFGLDTYTGQPCGGMQLHTDDPYSETDYMSQDTSNDMNNSQEEISGAGLSGSDVYTAAAKKKDDPPKKDSRNSIMSCLCVNCNSWGDHAATGCLGIRDSSCAVCCTQQTSPQNKCN